MVITFGIIAKPDYKKQKSESVDLASDVVFGPPPSRIWSVQR